RTGSRYEGGRTMNGSAAALKEELDRLLRQAAAVSVARDRAEGTLVGIPHYSVIEARAHELGRELSRRIQARPAPPRGPPRRRLAPGLVYATVRKERKKGWVVSIRRSIVLGDEPTVEALLKASVCSRTINTSFVERRHGTDRGQNARKSRRSYRFSKDWEVHVAMSDFTGYRSNFCWPVRTLRTKAEDGRWQQRTPAMAAGLAIMVGPWRNGSTSRPFSANRTLPNILDSSILRESTASFQGPTPL